MRPAIRALIGVSVAWAVTWLVMAIALQVVTGSASQALELWYVGIPTVVLLAAAWLPRGAEMTLAFVLAVPVLFVASVLFLDQSGYALAVAITLGVPAWLMLGSIAGMTAMHDQQAARWRWLTRRRIDVWLHHRHES